MKKKDLQSLRAKTKKELEAQVAKKRLELAKRTVEFKVSKKKSPKKCRLLKFEIAQTLTIIREKELMEQVSEKVKEQKKA